MTQASTQRPRVPALDLLRGAAVAGMILVNTPGSWAHIYPQLEHAAWNGLHLADMVFPTFLFGVGTALGLSFPRPFARPSERWRLWRRLARRVAALVGLGLGLSGAVLVAVRLGWGFAGGDTLADLRLPGVLQRIGLCYGLAAAWAIASGRQRPDGRRALRPVALLAATAAVLAGYWLLLERVPVPGVGAGWRTPTNSLPGYVDRLLFGVRHLWPLGSATGKGPPTFDPEGLLSTLPATANVLLGALAGWTWRAQPAGAAGRVALGGLCAALLGAAIAPVDPVNKSLWSASFALLSSGGSAALLAGFAWVAARPGPLLSPLHILGGNAILAYVLSELFELFCGWRWLPGTDGRTGLEAWAFQQLVRVLPYPKLASLLCAMVVLAGITLALRPLHRRAIHFRL